jgi:hypothetical protein
MESGEHFVRDFSLYGDQVKRRNADGAARADALRCNVEQLPVQVESALRAKEVSGKHERDQQLLSNRKRVKAGDGQRHERAGWTNNKSRNARQPRRDSVSEGEAVEWRHLSCSKIGERQHDERALRGAVHG